MTISRSRVRSGLIIVLMVVGTEQAWRHGRDYVFAAVRRGRAGQDLPRRLAAALADAAARAANTRSRPCSPWPTRPTTRWPSASRGWPASWAFAGSTSRSSTSATRRIPRRINDKLEAAAAVLADPANYPVYFHCHHGINRASMVQIAYRTKYCGWTLEQATDEIRRTFGLVEVNHGPDYRHMEIFYADRVLPCGKTLQQRRSGIQPGRTARAVGLRRPHRPSLTLHRGTTGRNRVRRLSTDRNP